jgi:hypothetical protein
VSVALNGARDVAIFAAHSDQAQQAFVEQVFHHIVKQPALAYGPRVLTRLRRAFQESGFSVQQLLVETASLTALQGIEAEMAAE